MRKLMIVLMVTLAAAAAQATPVMVEATGQVIYNAINDPPLSDVGGGEMVMVSFMVDSETFDEGNPGDTRGYVIDHDSFLLSFSGGVAIGLLDPFPGGQTPYFTLVEGFPVSDGFFVSTSPFSPGGVPINQGDFQFNLDLGYVGETLDSLDILDALGVYDFDGLTRFAMDIWRIFPDNVAMGMDFVQLTIMAPVASEESTWSDVKAMYR